MIMMVLVVIIKVNGEGNGCRWCGFDDGGDHGGDGGSAVSDDNGRGGDGHCGDSGRGTMIDGGVDDSMVFIMLDNQFYIILVFRKLIVLGMEVRELRVFMLKHYK